MSEKKNPLSDAELQAAQAAEEQKGDPALDEVEAAPIEAAEAEKEEPFDKLAARARRLSPDRARTIVESLLFLAERPLGAEEIRAATGLEVPRIAQALDSLSLGIGYLAPLWTQRRQTFGDMLTQTVVIKASGPLSLSPAGPSDQSATW